MNTDIAQKTQLIGAWSGILYVVLLLLGWTLIAGYVPAHPPSASAEEIAAIYAADSVKIRAGMIFIMFAAMMCIPFAGALAQMLYRVEGGLGMLTASQIMAGIGNTLLTFYPPMWWIIASFRVERSPEMIQLLNDIGWIQLIGGLTPFLPMLLTVGFAALHDKNENAPFPRWVGFFNLWVFVLVLPGQLLFFFKTGPFAWNGILAFWVPVIVFCCYFLVMQKVIRDDAKRTYLVN